MKLLRKIGSSIQTFGALLVVTLHLSCSPSPEYSFQCDGVQLTCPLGWAVTDNEDNGFGYYLSVEKNGWDSSGIMSFSWVNESVDLRTWFALCCEGFVSEYQVLGMDGGFSMGPTYSSQFGRYSAIASDFTSSFLGVDHEGTLFALQARGKAFFILRQEAIEDHFENMNGFRVIEDSFFCQ